MRYESTREANASVTFVLTGDFSPEAITEFTGLTPTKTARAGEVVRGDRGHTREHSAWEIRAGTNEAVSVGEQMKELVQILEPGWPMLVELGKRHESGFRIRVYIYDPQGPEVYFEKEVLQQIGQLAAYIDLDLYCLSGDREEDGPGG